jgi:alginate O-acetyltransferase complex protein AlgI
MLFNSLHFLFFLPIVFGLYWYYKNALKWQNLLLLIASYYFYACWDWRFLFLLFFSTFLDYFTGLKMEQSKTLIRKKTWFWISILANLGFLGFFKYYNFFISSFADFFSNIGYKINPWTLKIILPVGISFYTFHGLSYVIDIYYNRIKAEKDFIHYAVFVSFFPLLVAGPIERATHLLPQIKKERRFNYSKAIDGLRQILWGLFKKIVIADQCAEYVNVCFEESHNLNASSLILGAVFFSFQIYGDFSGYSDIALGTARLFGIELLKNFNYPYFSRDIAEFWRRWHISLSSWFKDYLYIPLGGSKGSTWLKIRNTFIIFLVSGFWHGANWTFIFWGFLNALFIIPSVFMGNNRNNMEIVAQNRWYPNLKELFSIVFTFTLTTIAWIFFRAKNMTEAFEYLYNIGSLKGAMQPTMNISFLLVLLVFFIVMEWQGRRENHPLKIFALNWNKALRIGFYYLLVIIILIHTGAEQEFIYFQF